uniref:Uncharacterized protein n=1 Tax=Spongospora subterranea TaxID=70186 RepID=A0A0H5QS72_9EUKA|eukprot:CRZ04421.1 hypothetical protein [Spongospora subterranea]
MSCPFIRKVRLCSVRLGVSRHYVHYLSCDGKILKGSRIAISAACKEAFGSRVSRNRFERMAKLEAVELAIDRQKISIIEVTAVKKFLHSSENTATPARKHLMVHPSPSPFHSVYPLPRSVPLA